MSKLALHFQETDSMTQTCDLPVTRQQFKHLHQGSPLIEKQICYLLGWQISNIFSIRIFGPQLWLVSISNNVIIVKVLVHNHTKSYLRPHMS